MTSAGRLDSLISHNPVIAQLEAQGRTMDPKRLYPDPVDVAQVAPVPPPVPLLACALLEQQPTTLTGAPIELLFAQRPVDPSQQTLGNNSVVLRAMIDASGQWQDPEILKGSTPERDAAAMVVFSQLPTVKPAEVRGIAAPCLFTFPVRFKVPE
ncbi:MAG: energy transducer TonB [Flavobacteriales bacterium]|nr:energy transducer TonB [Flavobacteriales bacterium]